MARRSPPFSTPSFEGPFLCSEPGRALEALGWYMGNHGARGNYERPSWGGGHIRAIREGAAV